MSRKFVIAGNWKMNAGPAETETLISELKAHLGKTDPDCDIVVFPPSISLITAVRASKGSAIQCGAQNVHFEDNGAFTGEISTSMLKEAGLKYVLVGHSERRQFFGETDQIAGAKVKKIISAGMVPVLCVGEKLEERKKGSQKSVVEKQLIVALDGLTASELSNIVIAYEPVWAIGTGETASPQQAQDMHQYIRKVLSDLSSPENASRIRILYGGSMKPENAGELLGQPDVDGGLIGGASLKADSFYSIIQSAVNL
jgi:triosephosphate isomerase